MQKQRHQETWADWIIPVIVCAVVFYTLWYAGWGP